MEKSHDLDQQSFISTTLCGICIKRQQLLVVWNAKNELFELPSVRSGDLQMETSDSLQDNLKTQLLEFFELTLGTQIVRPSSLQKVNEGFYWAPVVFQKPPEVKKQIINWKESTSFQHFEKVWIPLAEAQSNTEIPLNSQTQKLLQSFSKDSGNSYVEVHTFQGVPTFMHLQTGEILHSQEGPTAEAEKLYIEPLNIRKSFGSKTVFDCGLGCGTLAIRCFEAFLENKELQHLHIVSFDLEKSGLLALERSSEFALFTKEGQNLFKEMQTKNSVSLTLENEKTFHWNFIEGDFCKTILNYKNFHLPPADFVMYDFFSPKSQPDLWEIKTLKALRECCSENCLLSTYCSATAVRSHFLQAGFFVGEGVASGKKTSSTMAATNIHLLQKPLSHKFLTLYENSQAPFLFEEKENMAVQKSKVLINLKKHEQWTQVLLVVLISILNVFCELVAFATSRKSASNSFSEKTEILTPSQPVYQLISELLCKSKNFQAKILDGSQSDVHSHSFIWTPLSKKQISEFKFFVHQHYTIETWLPYTYEGSYGKLQTNQPTQKFFSLHEKTETVNFTKIHFWNSPATAVELLRKLETQFSSWFPMESANFKDCRSAFESQTNSFLTSAKSSIEKKLLAQKKNTYAILTSHDTHNSLFNALKINPVNLPANMMNLKKMGPGGVLQARKYLEGKNIDAIFYDEGFPRSLACGIVQNKKVPCEGPLMADDFPKNTDFFKGWSRTLSLVERALESNLEKAPENTFQKSSEKLSEMPLESRDGSSFAK